MIKQIVQDALPHLKKMTIIISGTEERCSVVLMPESKEKGMQITPINALGPVDKVEETLEKAIKAVFADNSDVLSNYEDVAKEVKSGGKGEKVAPAKTASTKPSPAPKKSAKVKDSAEETPEEENDETGEENAQEPAPEKVTYTKDQKALIKKVEDSVKRAEGSSDPAMWAFCRSSSIKNYKNGNLPEADITALEAKFEEIRKAKGFAVPEADGEENAPDPQDGLFKQDEKAEKKAEVKKEEKPVEKTPPAKAAETSNEDEDDGMIF